MATVFAALRKPLLAAAIVASAGPILATCSGAPITATSSAAAPASNAAEIPRRFRLLTTEQYTNTIQGFFGPDIKVDAKFAPLPRTDGVLAAGSAIAGMSGAQVEIYQKIANLVSTQVVDAKHRMTLLPCTPKSETARDDACASKFLGAVLQALYHRPPTKARVDEIVGQAGTAADQLKDFYAGMQIALEGVLLSPEVLFLAERTEPNAKQKGLARLDSYSLASRLSLFLWNAAPDAALMEAAAKGQLDTPNGRARVIDRMLASPRLEAGVRAFFQDVFDFEAFENLAKDAAVYPYFLGDMATEAREQTLRTVVDHLITKKRDYRDLFTTRETFVSQSLAIIYGLPAPSGWKAVTFSPESHRDGILTHVSFLALHSHPARSSPTVRGKALRELILCQKVPAPPANVDFSAVENPDPRIKTTRERVAFHLQNPVCAGCHRITDPIGLALENFDGAGKYRAEENGAPIDASGNLDSKPFTTVAGLGEAVRNHPALPKCVTRRALTYAVGGAVPAGAEPVVADLTNQFAAHGYRFPDLLKAIAMSDSFIEVGEPAETPAVVKADAESSSQIVAKNPEARE